MAFLSLSRDDATFAYAVLAEAERLRGEHDKAIADYGANRIAGLIVPVIVKNTTRTIRWLGKSLGG